MVQNTSASPRLLVVDSDEDDRSRLRRGLTRCGYEVFEAADGARALPLIGMIPFDLVLLAKELPDGDGLELLRRMRESRSRAELPIVLMAAGEASADMVEALGWGADDYLAKPLDLDLACARAALQVRRKRDHDAGVAAHRELEQDLATLRSALAQAEAAQAQLAAARLEGRVAKVDGRGTTQLRALSADDDAQSRFAVRAALHHADTAVELVDVASGLQAALAAETGVFDLILVNVVTADALAGIRAIRRMERQAQARRTPILAIGAETPAAARALQAGADLHLAQPVTAEALRSALALIARTRSEGLSAAA